jgi:Fe-S-cluster-containing dehydrogenase component
MGSGSDSGWGVSADMVIAERVVIDLDRCIECKACFAACYYGHRQEPIINYGSTDRVTIPLICRQCDKPACVDACVYGAMYTDDCGIVKRSLLTCQGCGSCVTACPFGTVTPEMHRHQVPKCDACEDLVLQGDPPRCVAACSAGALQFIRIAEVELEQQGLYALSGRALGHDLLKRR